MKFRLEFDCDNAAFDDDVPDHGCASECARILRELANRLDQDGTAHANLHDVNGNRIGAWSLAEPCTRWTANEFGEISCGTTPVLHVSRYPFAHGAMGMRTQAEAAALAHTIVAALNATDKGE